MFKISRCFLRISLWLWVMALFGQGFPACAQGYKWVTQWGGQGVGNGQFDSPMGIALDRSGHVYVSDYGNNCVQKFTAAGKFLLKWGNEGDGEGQFRRPAGLAVDKAGIVYVADSGNCRIEKFNSSGNFMAAWGKRGNRMGDFGYYDVEPKSVALDAKGDVYVVDGRIRSASCRSNWIEPARAPRRAGLPWTRPNLISSRRRPS